MVAKDTADDLGAQEGKSGRERRKYLRAGAEWPLEIALESGTHQARLRDVSRAGLCFFMEEPIPMMTVLHIGLDLPTDDGVRRITGSGAVVRCEPLSSGLHHYEIAVFLHDLKESDREALDEHAIRMTSLGEAADVGRD